MALAKHGRQYATAMKGVLRFLDDHCVALDDKLHFSIRKQSGYLPDFNGDSDLTFTGDTHEGILGYYSYLTG